jgi:hypothetical protein
MLRACGERGYRRVGAGAPPGAAERFAAGYGEEAARMRRGLARAAAAGAGRRQLLEAVLAGLAGLIEERPAVARGLLAEVHVVGGPAMRERALLLADLARAIEGAYREEAVQPPPPPAAAAFMVEVIETVALRAAVEEDAGVLETAIPDLAAMLEELYGPGGG